MPRSKLNPNQVNEDTLQDEDNDTTIKVETSADEDKIRLSTNGSERMIIDDTGKVGLGTSTPTEMLTINGVNDAAQPAIQFTEAGADRVKIFVNSSNNLEIKQQFTNKHIVFKVNDAGTTREAFRMDGTVPEVVVNQTGDSLVDFRVESDNNTHMLLERINVLHIYAKQQLKIAHTLFSLWYQLECILTGSVHVATPYKSKRAMR